MGPMADFVGEICKNPDVSNVDWKWQFRILEMAMLIGNGDVDWKWV